MKEIILILGIIGLIGLWLRYRELYQKLQESYKETLHKLRSLRVVFGKTWEKYCPLLKDFPCDRKDAHFLGMPVDFVCFSKDKVRFVEIKTQGSKLSPKQEHIKSLIQNKKIEWHELNYKNGQ